MRKRPFFNLIGVLAVLALCGCGAKPAMEGGQSDSETGTVVESGGSSGSESATGQGDSTSFSSENVEKVDEYEVRPGDNLWNISAKGSVYHSGWLFPLILKANRGKFKDPKDLKVGTMLKIPRGLPQAQYDVAREEAMAGVYDSEVGKISEASFASPLPEAKQGAMKGGAKPAPGKGAGGSKGGSAWIWILLLLAAGGGVFAWLKFRKKPAPQ
jgi:hypothetical protein